MANKQFRTLNQCIDYALKSRPQWVHSRSRQTIINNLAWPQKVWGNCAVSMIDWMAMDKLINTMKHQGLSPSTINKSISAVKTALLFCAQRHLIPEFPTCFVGARQHEPQQTPIVYTFDEVDAMVKYARSYEFMGRMIWPTSYWLSHGQVLDVVKSLRSEPGTSISSTAGYT